MTISDPTPSSPTPSQRSDTYRSPEIFDPETAKELDQYSSRPSFEDKHTDKAGKRKNSVKRRGSKESRVNVQNVDPNLKGKARAGRVVDMGKKGMPGAFSLGESDADSEDNVPQNRPKLVDIQKPKPSGSGLWSGTANTERPTTPAQPEFLASSGVGNLSVDPQTVANLLRIPEETTSPSSTTTMVPLGSKASEPVKPNLDDATPVYPREFNPTPLTGFDTAHCKGLTGEQGIPIKDGVPARKGLVSPNEELDVNPVDAPAGPETGESSAPGAARKSAFNEGDPGKDEAQDSQSPASDAAAPIPAGNAANNTEASPGCCSCCCPGFFTHLCTFIKKFGKKTVETANENLENLPNILPDPPEPKAQTDSPSLGLLPKQVGKSLTMDGGRATNLPGGV